VATDNHSTCESLPRAPGTAMMLALLYKRLGGIFSISSNGSRYFGRPEPALFRVQGRDVPQLAGAQPHEQFHSPAEWKGAIKLVEALLQRLDDADTNLVFGLLAADAIDPRKITSTIEEPKREFRQ